MRHIYRAVALLLIFPVLVVGVPWVVSQFSRTVYGVDLGPNFSIPATFGQFGYYRGANVEEWTSLSPKFSGDLSRCQACHGERLTAWQQGAHSGVKCESCHGPRDLITHPGVQGGGDGLFQNPSQNPRQLCLLCHDASVPGRPLSFPQVNPMKHAGEAQCTLCHNPHSPAFWK